jgi:HEAT repeat protein
MQLSAEGRGRKRRVSLGFALPRGLRRLAAGGYACPNSSGLAAADRPIRYAALAAAPWDLDMPRLSTRDLLLRGNLKALQKRGAACLPDVRKGLSDSSWKVRRNALRVLDHVPNSGATAEMIGLLQDENDQVRKWAAHALGCDRCKPGSNSDLDPVPHLIEAANLDPSIEVRRSAVVCLAWNRPPDPRIGSFLEDLADGAEDPKILLHARAARSRHALPASAV